MLEDDSAQMIGDLIVVGNRLGGESSKLTLVVVSSDVTESFDVDTLAQLGEALALKVISASDKGLRSDAAGPIIDDHVEGNVVFTHANYLTDDSNL